LELEHRENSSETCAALACRIEIERLGEPIGKQDQYAAAYGGLNFVRFNPEGSVTVEPLRLSEAGRQELENRMVMIYTGQTRAASSVLSDQKRNTETDPATFERLRRMREMAEECRLLFLEDRIDDLGPLLHRGWLEKKRLTGSVSSPEIDQLYEAGLAAGATGGKLLGAGGGGFLLFLCPPERRRALVDALGQPRVFYPRLEPRGSQVIYGA
jgi:D-glycero-alpha-D-manno-heptose-7-phosphate kinase